MSPKLIKHTSHTISPNPCQQLPTFCKSSLGEHVYNKIMGNAKIKNNDNVDVTTKKIYSYIYLVFVLTV